MNTWNSLSNTMRKKLTIEIMTWRPQEQLEMDSLKQLIQKMNSSVRV